jgi:hypothetical protein
MDVHVSTMTGKLEGFRAINSNTRSNPFCFKMYENARADVICRSCYSHEMLKGIPGEHGSRIATQHGCFVSTLES